MNIAIDIRPLMTMPRTGVGEYSFELLDAVFKIDRINNYFLVYNSWDDVSKNIPEWDYENIQMTAKHYPNKLYNGSMSLFGRPYLDLLTTGGKKPVSVFFSPNLNFTAVSKKSKFILTVHDLSFHFFPEFSTIKQYWWHKIINPQKQCRRADAILVPSNNTKRDIINTYGINADKIKVIYPGVKLTASHEPKTNKLKSKYQLPENFILFLGTIEPRKNISGLIEAYEILLSKFNIQKSLVIAGAPGWKNTEIFERVKKSKYSDKIKFIGFIDPEDKPELYSIADVFVYPSLYEGFGFPVLEAMQAGTAVVTSNRSSLPEITESSAYLADPTRPEQIALGIKELLTCEKLKQWHIQKGFEQVKKFSWEKTAREWLNTINEI